MTNPLRACLLSLLLAVAALAALAPPAAAHEGPSTCGGNDPDYWECEFVCHKGDRLRVRAHTTGPDPDNEWPRVRATCGGVDVYCQANGQCQAASRALVQYDDVGRCVAETVYADGACSATSDSPLPNSHVRVGVAGVSTPAVAPRDVATPDLARVCAPGALVCAGPVRSVPVASLPGVEPVALTPSLQLAVDREVEEPSLRFGPAGPFAVAGEPVPVTVCDRTCPLTPEADAGRVEVRVALRADGETLVDETLLLP